MYIHIYYTRVGTYIYIYIYIGYTYICKYTNSSQINLIEKQFTSNCTSLTAVGFFIGRASSEYEKLFEGVLLVKKVGKHWSRRLENRKKGHYMQW
jgi:hypothetical protein